MSGWTDELTGTWLHSHEEDTESEWIYRRSSFDFPPSRGRTGYEFQPNNVCIYKGISPRDGSTEHTCSWLASDDSSGEIVLTYPDGKQQVLQIASIERDRLVIKKP